MVGSSCNHEMDKFKSKAEPNPSQILLALLTACYLFFSSLSIYYKKLLTFYSSNSTRVSLYTVELKSSNTKFEHKFSYRDGDKP